MISWGIEIRLIFEAKFGDDPLHCFNISECFMKKKNNKAKTMKRH